MSKSYFLVEGTDGCKQFKRAEDVATHMKHRLDQRSCGEDDFTVIYGEFLDFDCTPSTEWEVTLEKVSKSCSKRHNE